MTAGFETKIKLPYASVKGWIGTPLRDRIIKFPFIFCGKNFALAQNGTIASWNDYSQDAQIAAGSLVENIIDGSRITQIKIEQLSGGYYLEPSGPAKTNFGSIRLDMSEAMSGRQEINIVCLEQDTIYPVGEIEIRSYTDSGFSANLETHNISQEFWQFVTPNWLYFYGVQPKIDTIPLGTFDDDGRLTGLDGKFVFFMLQNPITSDRPYVAVDIRGVGRSRFGYNADFKQGRFTNKNDETLETSDPNTDHTDVDSPVYGHHDNYIQLDATDGTLKQSGGYQFNIRADHTYILQYYQKTVLPSGPTDGDVYRPMIQYYDWENILISTHSLMQDLGLFAQGVKGVTPGTSQLAFLGWARDYVLINMLKDGRRQSGKQTQSQNNPVHNVPPGAKSVRIWFRLNSDSGWATKPIWNIDDVSISSINNRPPIGSLSQIRSPLNYGSLDIYQHNFYEDFDFDGDVRINRVGMYQYNFSTSKQKDQLAQFQDLGGFAGANFASVSYVVKGKAQQRNISGRIISQFIPKSGTKHARQFQVIATKEMKEAIEELYNTQTPFGLIEPQGEFADYIIQEGSMNFRAISAESLKDPANYLWEGTMVFEEI